MNRRQKGFAAVEITIVVVIVLGIIAFIVWRMLDSNSGTNQPAQQDTATTEEVAPIKNQEDLSKTEQQLDATAVEDGTDTELETETNF